jgi:hypothetical protein
MSDKPAYQLTSKIVRTVLGASLILLGILFLIGRYVSAQFDFDLGHYAWPLFILTPGVLLFLAAFAVERRAGIILAIFGGMVATTGAILLIQNTFDLYATWAYAWALVAPTSIGLAKLIYGGLRGLGDEVKSGLNLTGIGLAIFAFGAFFFELVIGISGFRFGAAWLCWPVLLIGLGIVFLLSNWLPRWLPRRNHPSGNNQGETRGDIETNFK